MEPFSIPSVVDVKKSSEIKDERNPSIFSAAKLSLDNNLSSDVTDVRVLGCERTSRNIDCSASVGEASTCQETIGGTSPWHPHAIIANAQQKNNPLMKYIRNVPWEVGNISPDFVLGKTSCALYLSVRYHCLHPEYIHERLRVLGRLYSLRILLVHVDTSEHQKSLKELAKISLLADLTLILAWSYEEAARYLETYKAYENKPPDLLKERIDSDFSSRVAESLTTVKKITKTDAGTLINTFKTMERIINCSKEDLTLCPGLGPQKAHRLYALFHEPFVRHKHTTSKE